jgi:hypothetical protein
VQELARAAYPTIIAQLTTAGTIPEETRIDFVHPAERSKAHGAKAP